MSVAVAVAGLRFAHPGQPVLFEDFDLDLPAGTVTALLGPSGSGKSTLLRLVAGLLAPRAGRVTRPVAVPGRAPVGVVFQDPRLLPWMTVEENAGFALTAAGIPRLEHAARIRPLLDAVGLDGAARPRTLSGGMAQRAGLVRALALQPELLLMDEPFAAVDPLLREDLQALVQPLLVGVTTRAVMLADRVLVLGGRPVRVQAEVTVAQERPRSRGFRESAACGAAMRALRERLFSRREG